mgnify:FL=1
MKERIKLIVVPSAYVLSIVFFAICLYFAGNIFKKSIALKNANKDTEYVDNEIIEKYDYVPVINVKETIIKPFTSSDVSVSRGFYDYTGEEETQENSIIFYENTYMQNSGIDYSSDNAFDVVSILPGEVIDLKADNIVGTTITIRHTNDLISVYQSLGDVNVKVDDKVVQGQIIAKSGKSNLNTKKENNLHFELYYKGEIVNPDNYYDKNLTDL